MFWVPIGGQGGSLVEGGPEQAGLAHPGQLEHRRVDTAAQGGRQVAGSPVPVGQG